MRPDGAVGRPLGRVAVLADIHGNGPALEAVLADVATAGVELLVLNGDLVDGPFPAETMQKLEALALPAIWLRGNGDRWLAEAHDGRFTHADPATDAMLRWAADSLTPAQRRRLAALPLTAILQITGLGQVGFCHATARSDNEMFLVDSTAEQAEAAFANVPGETLVLGHCHMPFDRLFGRRRMVNAGSVGMPYGHRGASWLLLGPDVVLKRSQYDQEAAAEAVLASGMPEAAAFADTYVRQTPSDTEALAAYRAIRERQQGANRYD